MSDVFRKKCRELIDLEKQIIFDMKSKAEELKANLDAIDQALGRNPNNLVMGAEKGQREMAIARTKLEEAVMWATKSITA